MRVSIARPVQYRTPHNSRRSTNGKRKFALTWKSSQHSRSLRSYPLPIIPLCLSREEGVILFFLWPRPPLEKKKQNKTPDRRLTLAWYARPAQQFVSGTPHESRHSAPVIKHSPSISVCPLKFRRVCWNLEILDYQSISSWPNWWPVMFLRPCFKDKSEPTQQTLWWANRSYKLLCDCLCAALRRRDWGRFSKRAFVDLVSGLCSDFGFIHRRRLKQTC